MVDFTFFHDANADWLGFIPMMLNEADPRDAVTQLHEAYAHGGGWHDFNGFTLLPSGDLSCPGDPITRRIATATLRNETINIYEHAWVAVIQPDGSFRISGMD